MRQNRAMGVTGVAVNAKPSVCREELRRLRAILHRTKTSRTSAAWLEGEIAFARMVNPTPGLKLQPTLEALA